MIAENHQKNQNGSQEKVGRWWKNLSQDDPPEKELRPVEKEACPFSKSSLILVDDALCGESVNGNQEDQAKKSKTEVETTLKFLQTLFVRNCHHEKVGLTGNKQKKKQE